MTLHIDDLAAAHDALVVTHQRSLCKFDNGEVFAYVDRGSDFIRTSDHELWATERNDTLLSVRSGEPLAVRRGKVWFSADTDEPLYYERAI